VHHGDLDINRDVETPQLPVRIVQILIRPGQEIIGIEIKYVETEEITPWPGNPWLFIIYRLIIIYE
jgi:hypothetical protein